MYFGILQAWWAIIRGAARMFDEEVLWSIMIMCIILHNMIVENEYDYNYDEPKMFKLDPMNTTLTRIYQWPVGANGQPLEHEPLIRNSRYNNYNRPELCSLIKESRGTFQLTTACTLPTVDFTISLQESDHADGCASVVSSSLYYKHRLGSD
ncbi:hypothetical protein GBA52_026066 [Prunus armeniaca]|nr:hypothetical protein GBA52_026066 [Prunus armeniaca]